MKKIWILFLSMLVLSWCTFFNQWENNIVDNPLNTGIIAENNEAYLVLQELSSQLWIASENIQITQFDWVDRDLKTVSVDWYKLTKSGFQESEVLTNFFERWRMGIENVGAATIEWREGYDKGYIVCIAYQSMPFEDGDIQDTWTTFLMVSCGKLSKDQNSENGEQEVLFEAFGSEPFWNFVLDGEKLSFDSPFGSEKYTVSVEEDWDTLFFSLNGQEPYGMLVKKDCEEEDVSEEMPNHEYTAEITVSGVYYQWCANKIQKYANGDHDFAYGQTGSFTEFLTKAKIDPNLINIQPSSYFVSDIMHSYISVQLISDLDEENSTPSYLIMQKKENWWELLYTWPSEPDYDSCTRLQDQESSLRDFSILQFCSENMARG